MSGEREALRTRGRADQRQAGPIATGFARSIRAYEKCGLGPMPLGKEILKLRLVLLKNMYNWGECFVNIPIVRVVL